MIALDHSEHNNQPLMPVLAFTLADELAWAGHDCPGGCPESVARTPASAWFLRRPADPGPGRGSLLVILPDGLVWLRFDDRPFVIGDLIEPSGYLPPGWQRLYDINQLRLDRVYIVAAAGPDRVSPAAWNERRRWCYHVEPQMPLEQDPDPTHDFFYNRRRLHSSLAYRTPTEALNTYRTAAAAA